jgi:hypothetical protein
MYRCVLNSTRHNRGIVWCLLFLLLLHFPTTTASFQCPNLLSAAHAQYVGQLQHRDSHQLEMETLSLTPPIWRVKDFLTPVETELLIQRYKQGTATASSIRQGKYNAFGKNGLERMTYKEGWEEILQNNTKDMLNEADMQYFMNSKGFIQLFARGFHVLQLKLLLRVASHMSALDVTEAKACMAILDKDSNAFVTQVEWNKRSSWKKLSRLFKRYRRNTPEKFTRHSDTLWMKPLNSVNKRLASFLGIPQTAIETFMKQNRDYNNVYGEDVQLVHYYKKGHYSCHYDSESKGHYNNQYRAYTVMFQLRDIKKGAGGGTWFPFSKNVTHYDCTHNKTCLGSADGGSGFVLPSLAGSAIIWMNHRPRSGVARVKGGPWGIDPNKDGFQPLDVSSLHSGCEVLSGEKWIANQWVFKSAVEKLCNIDETDMVEEVEVET